MISIINLAKIDPRVDDELMQLLPVLQPSADPLFLHDAPDVLDHVQIRWLGGHLHELYLRMCSEPVAHNSSCVHARVVMHQSDMHQSGLGRGTSEASEGRARSPGFGRIPGSSFCWWFAPDRGIHILSCNPSKIDWCGHFFVREWHTAAPSFGLDASKRTCDHLRWLKTPSHQAKTCSSNIQDPDPGKFSLNTTLNIH